MKIDPSGLEVPDGKDPIFYVWGELVPGIGPAASAFAQSVYEHATLELATFEAARLRVAQINGCLFCQDWRTERDGQVVPDGFDTAVEAWRDAPGDVLDDRARLAAEYAERFTLDHHGIDADLWARLHERFNQQELVELSMCLGSWIAFGRLNHVFGLDAACTLPSHR